MRLPTLFAQAAAGGGSNTLLIVLAVLVIGLILFLLFVIGIYNKLVSYRNQYKNAYSQIDVQLKRRYDLIPNLVEVAKGYMKHERETLEAVIAARNAAASANQRAAASPGDSSAMKDLAASEAALSGSLGRLFALAEAYPDLKANTNMLSLQEELTATENKVAFSRQAYNDAVTRYNTEREVFPSVVIANFFNFAPATLFELENKAEKDPIRVSFT